MQNIKKKVAFYTLGCKLNFAETSTISRYFIEKDFEIVKFSDEANFYVINTCSVTSNADKKSRNSIARAFKKNPNAIIIVTGCYAQLKAEDISKIYGVDYVFGANNKDEIYNIIDTVSKQEYADIITCNHNDMKKFYPAYSKGDRTRSFLKIQDGCDYFCTYCTIPYARGRSRNIEIKKVVEQVNDIVAEGLKEIIISGVNIGDFGKSTNENFFELLKVLSNIEGVERYRIGSIEPNLLTDEIIEFIAANQKFAPHFHIPLQSGCNSMLKLMNRKYDIVLFRHKIEKIKRLIPDAFIGIDLIVGVNGETKEYFNETVDFVNSLDISFIHHFQYSERSNTKAIELFPKLMPLEKQERSKAIKSISDQKHKKFLLQNIGKTKPVLFEATKKNNKMYGYTDNYIKVEVDYCKNLINKVINVKLINFAREDILHGEINN
jgi:threonylcarbamoyladenosine tRNA methylthiotransferase MtaB